MEPGDFDMRRRDRCICGHALRLFGKRSAFFAGWESQLGAGANLLGLSTDQARELFAPVNRARHSAPTPIHRMRREWCAISRPPIPSIGASLASFGPRWSEAVSSIDCHTPLPPPPQCRVIMGRGLMLGRLKAAADQQGAFIALNVSALKGSPSGPPGASQN
jgi:hypothetical protein